MKIEFTNARDDGEGHWIVDRRITRDDGTVEEGIHAFPYDTLEWRAAEYGIDPSDVDTLLDIVLSEPYMTREDYAVGATLHEAETVEDARKAHLSRAASVKLRHRISTRGAKLPHLAHVKENAVMHPEAIELKREMVTRARDDIRRERRQSKEDKEARRVADLRVALRHMDHDQRNPR